MQGERGLLCFKTAEGAIRSQGSLLRPARVGQVGFLASESVSPAIRPWINESRSYRVLYVDRRQLYFAFLVQPKVSRCLTTMI